MASWHGVEQPQLRRKVETASLATDPSLIPFSFTFTGLTCSTGAPLDSYYVAGTFDFHLQGMVAGSPQTVTFANQHIVFDAVVSGNQPMGTCRIR